MSRCGFLMRLRSLRQGWQDGQVHLCVVISLEKDTDSTVGKDCDVAVGSGVWEDDPRVRPGLSVIEAHSQHQEVSPFTGRVREENNSGLITC